MGDLVKQFYVLLLVMGAWSVPQSGKGSCDFSKSCYGRTCGKGMPPYLVCVDSIQVINKPRNFKSVKDARCGKFGADKYEVWSKVVGKECPKCEYTASDTVKNECKAGGVSLDTSSGKCSYTCFKPGNSSDSF